MFAPAAKTPTQCCIALRLALQYQFLSPISHMRCIPLLFASLFLTFSAKAAEPETRWWKGNLHTHSLWSDGDDYPEMITHWYKEHGYHFLAISDHNVLANRERWIPVEKNAGGEIAFKKYLEKFGPEWVEVREVEIEKKTPSPKASPATDARGTDTEQAEATSAKETQKQVRLKMLSEYRVPFEEPGRFLLIQSEEITARNIHINATNIQELILPYTAFDPKKSESMVNAMQRTIDAVMEQRRRTGVPMFPHINHPNFKWAITAEELMQLDNERFFEVYNGHPDVHNEGDETHASTDRVWDIILTERLARLRKEPMFGIATDDSHHYHDQPKKMSRTGRGWVMVKAAKLTVEDLIAALEAGDFYASSGVILKDIKREKDRISLEIEAEPGVTYTTEFIGTRHGYNSKSEPVLDENGTPLRVTRRYSEDVGALLAKVEGTSASYTFKGDEIYVRARVTSSKPKTDAVHEGEVEKAWVQPVQVSGREAESL